MVAKPRARSVNSLCRLKLRKAETPLSPAMRGQRICRNRRCRLVSPTRSALRRLLRQPAQPCAAYFARVLLPDAPGEKAQTIATVSLSPVFHTRAPSFQAHTAPHPCCLRPCPAPAHLSVSAPSAFRQRSLHTRITPGKPHKNLCETSECRRLSH